MPSEEQGRDFLQHQGDARSIRKEDYSCPPRFNHRPKWRAAGDQYAGHHFDRQSSGYPKERLCRRYRKARAALDISVSQLQSRLNRYRNKSFMYLARQLPTPEAERILDLGVPGVSGRQEYKRFYPAGEVTAQLVGFTDINDDGQEGMELAYNAFLTGESGSKKVVKDLRWSGD